MLFTGCGIKQDISMTINNDKSLNLEIIKVADNELIDKAINEENNTDKTYTDQERWAYIESEYLEQINTTGFKFEKYESGEYKGYKFYIKIDNIDDITDDEASFDIDNNLGIQSSKVFKKEKNKYVSKIYFTNVELFEGEETEMLFSVTLPVEPISHNATSVSEDKKTLTWNLVSSTDKEIKFEFSFPNEQVEDSKNKNKLIIGIVASIIILIIIVLIILKIRKKEEF